jgi:hypothetical protein
MDVVEMLCASCRATGKPKRRRPCIGSWEVHRYDPSANPIDVDRTYADDNVLTRTERRLPYGSMGGPAKEPTRFRCPNAEAS